MLACASMYVHPGHVDFLSYWAAGRLALQGHPSAAYDLSSHRAVELTAVSKVGLIPFPYPPAFLLAVVPFALFPLWLAFALWLLVSIGAYLLSIRRFAEPAVALAHPSVLSNGLIGQNGFLTTAVFAGGVSLLTTSPIAAGAVLGLLSYKPQLALLIPLALIAGREWKALAAAALSAGILWLAAIAAFGTASYAGFLYMLPRYAEFVAAGEWQWAELASPFAFLRFFRVSQEPALGVQVLLALWATASVCRLWWRKADGRAAALAAAALLIPPYLFSYDALILVVAFGWLIERRRYGEFLCAWLFCLLPVAGSFGFYSGPNTIPLAAILCLASVGHGRHRSRERPDLSFNPLPPAAAS